MRQSDRSRKNMARILFIAVVFSLFESIMLMVDFTEEGEDE
jgi:hypothetical protein